MCYSSISIEKPGGKGAKDRISVPCGKCYACRMNRRIGWTYRLSRELHYAFSAYFVTLTYSDVHIPNRVDRKTGEIRQVLRKYELQSFIKRLRYYSKFRYYAVGEYGEKTERPHYHLLIFNLSRKAAKKIGEVWKYGNVHIGQVETRSIHYCTKDMMYDSKKSAVLGVSGFRMMSTKPPIGVERKTFVRYDEATGEYVEYKEAVLDNYMNNKLGDEFRVWLNGWKIAMPRYFKDKIFSIKQKEEHAEKMRIEADKQFHEYLERCEKKGIKNPFSYLEKERYALLRQESKMQRLRKLR